MRTGCLAAFVLHLLLLAREPREQISVEGQRAAAREMVKFFQERQYREQVKASRTLGWTPRAEISNGRWVMFGLLVGGLTEYSTGVSFVQQIKLVLVNLGIVDFD